METNPKKNGKKLCIERNSINRMKRDNFRIQHKHCDVGHWNHLREFRSFRSFRPFQTLHWNIFGIHQCPAIVRANSRFRPIDAKWTQFKQRKNQFLPNETSLLILAVNRIYVLLSNNLPINFHVNYSNTKSLPVSRYHFPWKFKIKYVGALSHKTNICAGFQWWWQVRHMSRQ